MTISRKSSRTMRSWLFPKKSEKKCIYSSNTSPPSVASTRSVLSFPSFLCVRPELIDEESLSIRLKFDWVLGIYGFGVSIYLVWPLGIAALLLAGEWGLGSRSGPSAAGARSASNRLTIRDPESLGKPCLNYMLVPLAAAARAIKVC
jgi:hypothetical protein